MSAPIEAKALLRQIRISTFDAAAATLRDALTVGPVTCTRGCSNCCRQKVVVSTAEGMGVYLHLAATGRWTPALRAQLAQDDAYGSRVSHAEWFHQRRPCPFLRGAECSVYPVRPVGCLATVSFDGDPALCAEEDVEGRQSRGQAQVMSHGAPAVRGLLELYIGLDCQLPGSGYMTLAGAVLYASEVAGGQAVTPRLTLPFVEGHGDVPRRFDAAAERWRLTHGG